MQSDLFSVNRGPIRIIIRTFIAGTAYFLALFALGFVLGTIRVIIVAPRFGEFAAILAEVPSMLVAAIVICGWVVRRWQLSPAASIRWTMVLWFLMLLLAFESLLGAMLFNRTIAAQWEEIGTPIGMVGLSAQIIAAMMPVFIGRNVST